MFFRKKKEINKIPPDRKPVIRVSICTGEQVAGFKNLLNGKFEEVVLIRNRKDLDEFKEKYGITEDPEKIY